MHRFDCVAMAASLLLLFSPPSEAGTIYYRYIDTAYSPTDIAYAGGSGQLWTEV